jgi:hypothetical protein
MAIAQVVTFGFGSGASVAFVVTLGFSSAAIDYGPLFVVAGMVTQDGAVAGMVI